jgi:O-antigen/teichoic acid export membrane protein
LTRAGLYAHTTSVTEFAEQAPAPPSGERRLRTDVFVTFGGRIALLVLSAASTVVVARSLGPGGRGSVAVAYSLVVLLVQFGSLGLVSANPYFVARDASTRSAIVTNSVWLAGVLGAALVGVGILIKLVTPGLVQGLTNEELAIALVGIPAALAASFLQSILLGLGRMVAYNAVEVLASAGAVAALVVVELSAGLTVASAIAILVGTQIFAATAYVVLLKRDHSLNTRPDAPLAFHMFRYGLRVYAATMLAYLLIRFDLLLVNDLVGRTQAGYYSVAVAAADVMYLLPSVVALNLFARVARGGRTETTAEVFRSVSVLYALLCLISIPLARPAVHLLFGSAFAPAVPLYYWLLPGIYCLGMLNILANHFAGRGLPRAAVFVWIPALALNLAINLVFLPRGGAYIASLASTVSYALVLVLHMHLFGREAGGYGAMRPRLREVGRFVRVAFSRASD